MTNGEIVDALQYGTDVRNFPPEIVAEYCRKFGELSAERRNDVLGKDASEFAGKLIAYRMQIVCDTYELDKPCSPVFPNGMILNPAKNYKSPLRQKWLKLIPDGTPRAKCLIILARETGVKNIVADIATEKKIEQPPRKDIYDDEVPF